MTPATAKPAAVPPPARTTATTASAHKVRRRRWGHRNRLPTVLLASDGGVFSSAFMCSNHETLSDTRRFLPQTSTGRAAKLG